MNSIPSGIDSVKIPQSHSGSLGHDRFHQGQSVGAGKPPPNKKESHVSIRTSGHLSYDLDFANVKCGIDTVDPSLMNELAVRLTMGALGSLPAN
jgi:hypothetical protein